MFSDLNRLKKLCWSDVKLSSLSVYEIISAILLPGRKIYRQNNIQTEKDSERQNTYTMIYAQTNRYKDRWIDRQIDSQPDIYSNREISSQIYRYTDKQKDD